MILLINAIAIFASFSLNQIYAVYWGAILPTLYAIIVAPQALITRPEIPTSAITKILADKWDNAADLTAYIVKYWMAFAYPATSWKKQRNSVILYLTSFVLGIVYFLRELFAAGIILFIIGYVLYQMSLRADRPRSVYANVDFRDSDNEFARKEWELAAMSIVAISDLYPDDRALKVSANEVSEDGDVKSLLAKYRHDGRIGVTGSRPAA
ncbi:hypothetical protein [Nitrosospira sp. NRS527]|uniref:hypothetical protein n=1 Tax=Nitrosospira sp. NRS527 TaxID=155925 RepID=UPI001AF289E5|nr:hypothetical protein [Nitrosospira sp. NRS527]BCT67441.1 hypothetical protein NNRS527_01025 [Nitrosospira sp. NRS527]